MARDKQYRDNAQKFDRDRLHSDEEAIGIIKSLGTKKFDETVDIAMNSLAIWCGLPVLVPWPKMSSRRLFSRSTCRPPLSMLSGV